jgi:quinoprotein glucose dehydrogenase
VSKLRVAWMFDTGDVSDGTKYSTRSAFEATPLMVDGVLYVSTPFCRVIAIDAETGVALWTFDPDIDKGIRTNLFVNRGVTYWTDGERKRILLGDLEGRLWALDAATGRPIGSFGNRGSIDLKAGMTDGFERAQYRVTSPPAVCGNVVISGALVSDGQPQGPSGDLQAFDVRDGKPLWRFHTVPRQGEYGYETWREGSGKSRGGANAWSILSVDEKAQMAFAPLTSPSYDFYGGDRKGENLFGNSVVALDCATGKRQWHFQTIHHDLWDYDLPAQPILADVRRNGKSVPALVQVAKTGFVFVLDRQTGAPLFKVEERPVPRSAIAGEETWPTQPFPVKPPPFARQSMRSDEITTVLPDSRAECLELIEGAKADVKLFDPLSEQNQVLFPGLNGGANWGGAAFDRRTGVLFINSMDVGGLFRLVPRPEGSSIPFALRSRKYEFFWDKNRYPCQQPPWGLLTAIDLNTGDFRWQVRLGEFDELKAKGIPKTGTPNLGGPIVTAAGLVFIAATNDRKFRAFDADTGQELWVTNLPASGFATPITYIGRKGKKQFVVIAAGGGNKYDSKFDSKLIAFSLP